MIVNGKQVEYQAISLLEYLRRHGYREDCVVIERGGEIITKERFGEIMLMPDDEINILQFMGGG